MVVNVLPADPLPPPPPFTNPKGQNSTFSEYGHVADQIKGNHKCSYMVPNILPAEPLPPFQSKI